MAYDRRRSDASATAPARRRINYQIEIGRVFVPVGVERDFVVLDPDRARTLRAWIDALIPARGERPAAGDVGAPEYVDATAFQAPAIRAVLIEAIDRVARLCAERHGRPFVEVDVASRNAILRAFEDADESSAFAMIRDLTYEAYYAHPRVLDALERETGWRYETAFSGGEMEPFDEGLLARMNAVAPRYRPVSQG